MPQQSGHHTILTQTNFRWYKEEPSDLSRVSIAAQAVSQPCIRTFVGIPAAIQRPGRLSMMHCITHQQGDIPAQRYLTPFDNRTRGHNTRLRQIPTLFSGYQHSFNLRMIVLWNRLRQIAVSQTMLEAFRTN